MKPATTLWSPGKAGSDPDMLRYTVGDDREVDARLLQWDIIGTLGHIESLAGNKIISTATRRRLRRAMHAAWRAAQRGDLTIGPTDEDVHSAVELWLSAHHGNAGAEIHLGRSRNDQVVVDLRLYLKDATLRLHEQMTTLADTLLQFAARKPQTLWPGYTHQRVAMPSSSALWAGGYAEGLLDAAAGVLGFWDRLDRSPLGSAAGYGVPLPLARERAARSLGFAAIDQMVTTTQNSRGQIEAQALAWCAGAAQECAKLSADVILYSADEFGWLRLPHEWSTGSSIMPQKRNPDVFELTRARAAAIEGDLAAVLAIRGKLPGGYHRDFQLLKSPLFRGLDRTAEILATMAKAIPPLEVDAARARVSLLREVFATDDVMDKVRDGAPFRTAYRQVAASLARGERPADRADDEVIASRSSTGNLGNLALGALRQRKRELDRWRNRKRTVMQRAIDRLLQK